jgi:tetratricopeptide (TPR) repeat protein
MHSLAVLLTVVSIAGADPLAPALEAFAREDYPRAERLALAQVRPPREGAALYLAGLARFRAGRPAEALDALDRAARAGDPPAVGLWQYNRGACLQELGRPAEAEAAFDAAASADPALAAVALVNAARAALDAGTPGRAAEHARRARAVAKGSAVALVAELEAELADGGAAEPVPGPEEGRAPRGLAARAGWEASLRLGGGYDSNVLQSGLQSTREVAPSPGEGTASVAATAGVTVARRSQLGEAVAAEVAYGADQVAYASTVVRDYSLQQHALAASVETTRGERWRLGLSLRGALAFTGLEEFRLLQGAGTVGGWVALDEARGAVTRVDAEWSRKVAPREEFHYLAGDRLDVVLSQTVSAGPLELGAAYRYREEAIGTVAPGVARETYRLPLGACQMAGCDLSYVIPLGYDSHAGAVTARLPLGERAALGAAAGFEWLRYRGESYLSVVVPPDPIHPEPTTLQLDRLRREDRRVYGALWASVRAWSRLDLTLRWDGVRNRSNVAQRAGGTHALDYDDKNYVKHVVGLEATWRW